jgi:flagellar hook-length control protein FliK
LPQRGNSLPPSGTVALPGIEPDAGDIPGNALALDALVPVPGEAPATISVQLNLPTAEVPAAPGDTELKTQAAAAAVASLHTVAAPATPAPAEAARSGLLLQIRYLEPGADAATRPVMDTGTAGTLQRTDAPPIPQPVSTTPQVTTGAQEFARQVTDAARTRNALMPAGAGASLPGDVQDLKAAQSVAPLPSVATIKAPTAANVAPSPAPMQWTSSFIDVAPGQAGWNEALGDRVTWMAGNRVQNAELRLNPAELGPLRVQISMDDGKASVTFTAQHPLTRDAIEQALPRLREMLADQGLSLQNASVSDHGSRQQQAGPGGERVAPHFGPAPGADGGTAEGEILSPVMRTPSGLVDVFA